MVRIFRKYFLAFFFIFLIVIFYSPFLLKFHLPLPTDTIVGLYHPYRDFFSKEFPRGIPFKNFLITDPIRQTYIWKELSISVSKKLELPLWNPYEMSGKPLLANFQSGAFYPLNLIFFISPFHFSWSVFIILQSFLGGYFLYLYLKNQGISSSAIFLGCISFVFSGFFTAWLEWGTIVSTGVWFPLILFSLDKLFEEKDDNKTLHYAALLCFSLLSSFFAGHLQTFFYIIIAAFLYGLIYSFTLKKFEIKKAGIIMGSTALFVLVSSIQWIPTLRFINLSNRLSDQNYLLEDGWFLPYKHLVQFLVPDFFGNPATLNYWGTWNYGELIGYVGMVPLIFAMYAFLGRINRKTFYFSFLLLLSFIFSLPTFLAKVPFLLNIPLVSSAQPTRLLFLINFSLVALAAFGFDYYNRQKYSRLIYAPIVLIGIMFILLWILVFQGNLSLFNDLANVATAKRNLVLPTMLFIISSIIILSSGLKQKRFLSTAIFVLFMITSADLLRFSSKFNTFSSQEFLYPETKTTKFLKEQKGIFRIASTDDRIFPPNFATHYKLQSVDGYDPLYLKSYGEYIAAVERNSPDISGPFGFNRIITPSNYNSQLFDLLNVKYLLAIEEVKSEKLKFLLSEGETKIYENTQSIPRTFFVDKIVYSKDEFDTFEKLFTYDLKKTAIVEDIYEDEVVKSEFTIGEAKIITYSENKVVIKTKNKGEGFLVLSDVFYPTWHAKIDNDNVEIVKTNHAFRGLVVPPGQHTITFYITLF